MNFTTNFYKASLIATAGNDQIIFGETTKKEFLQTLIQETIDDNYLGEMDEESKKNLMDTAILANDVLFDKKVELLNTSEREEYFKLLRSLFVINQQDIYIGEGEQAGFVTYHYKENELLLSAMKSFGEMAELSETYAHTVGNVTYTKSGIIDLDNLTLTVCLPAEMITYVSEVATINFTNNIKRLEEFPELKASVEAMYI